MRLCLRVAIYWCCCCLTMGLLLTGRLAIQEFPLTAVELWQRSVALYAAPLLTSLFFLPLVLVDLLSHTNRFTGPLSRIRGGLRQAATGRPVAPVQLRSTDFLQDLARDFNACMARHEVAPGGLGAATGHPLTREESSVPSISG